MNRPSFSSISSISLQEAENRQKDVNTGKVTKKKRKAKKRKGPRLSRSDL